MRQIISFLASLVSSPSLYLSIYLSEERQCPKYALIRWLDKITSHTLQSVTNHTRMHEIRFVENKMQTKMSTHTKKQRGRVKLNGERYEESDV